MIGDLYFKEKLKNEIYEWNWRTESWKELIVNKLHKKYKI